MNYAIEYLEAEAENLKKILNAWDCEYKPEAMKIRSDKLKSLEKSISYLKAAESFNNAVEGKTL